METLFGTEPTSPPPQRDHTAHPGPFAAVAIEQSVDRTLDYAIPPRLVGVLKPGMRVRVPLGRRDRPAYGFVAAIKPQADYPKIKQLLSIADERVLVPPALMELSRWISRYYLAPLGIVLESVIPSAVKKKIGVGYSQVVRLIAPRDRVQELLEKTKAPKRRAILARLLLLEAGHSIELVRLAAEAGATPPTVRKLAAMGLIGITSEPDRDGSGFSIPDPGLRVPGSGREKAGTQAVSVASVNPESRTLNPSPDQRRVLDDLLPRLDAAFSVNLLFGVTGSGKTEIYLRCIAQIVAQGRQAIVLVPEIALTTQTVRRFTARFARVAVLHSGLSATQRHRFWQQIAQGQADVVIGARSAIFAPLSCLGLIVVDEEHDSSYKQDTAPRYHGRDVAIKRAQLERIPILLGSATPSLEMWVRGHGSGFGVQGSESFTLNPEPITPNPSYHILRLPARVGGFQLPAVELVDMKVQSRLRNGIHLLSKRLEVLLRETLSNNQQAILLLNRRGYSNFVHCPSCDHVLTCRFCDKTMTYHRSAGVDVRSGKFEKSVHSGQLHCHYCLAVDRLPEKCPQCSKKLNLFGLGTQRVEEELARKFPEVSFARVDSDAMRSARDYETLLGRFARNEIQVLLGTQMISKGLDYPNVTLVGVISGDTAMSLPDFRAAERTFQMITQVAGRAGRGHAPGRVIVQTVLPTDPTIRLAIRQDFEGFAAAELPHRREIGLPPYARMARIILRDQDPQKLGELSESLAAKLREAAAVTGGTVQMRGPLPCPIGRIAGYHRQQIVLSSPRAGTLQQVLAMLRKQGNLARSARIAVDVDPVSLL